MPPNSSTHVTQRNSETTFPLNAKGKAHRLKDRTGLRYGRLLVLGWSGLKTKKGEYVWLCRCDCGKEHSTGGDSLHGGNARSCGCLKSESSAKTGRSHRIHGLTGEPMFNLWCRIHDRCENPKNYGFNNYGGRGIRLCSRWLCPETFIKDVLTALGEKPAGFSLDRINNDGNYEPGNVRWASRTEQNNNTRGNRQIEFRGETRNLNQWEKHLGFPPDSLRHRLRRGWGVEKAFSTPLKSPTQTR